MRTKTKSFILGGTGVVAMAAAALAFATAGSGSTPRAAISARRAPTRPVLCLRLRSSRSS